MSARLMQTEQIASWLERMTPLARKVIINELNRVTEATNRGREMRSVTRLARKLNGDRSQPIGPT